MTRRSDLERLQASMQAAGIYDAECEACGGAEPGTVGGLVVWSEEELALCEGCGAALDDGKPIAERVTVIFVHPPA